ncbi:MAG: type II toxin-antitoxin system HicB family antitoxin [Thermoleophilaceae bacterium]|nr:type II toxin-antitoxin system HicB family antitoxin [Thermoleophilaceae bacterium]
MTVKSIKLTIAYEVGDDGWILARVPQLPEVISQGRSRQEAREMVLDALRLVLETDAIQSPDSEQVTLAVAS